MSLKPWDELSDVEKREAISRRVGWPLEYWRVLRGDDWCPNWPFDDALAFTDVWPRLEAESERKIPNLYRIRLGRNALNSPTVFYQLKDSNCLHLGHPGTTYAQAICSAAYELLPETMVINHKQEAVMTPKDVDSVNFLEIARSEYATRLENCYRKGFLAKIANEEEVAARKALDAIQKTLDTFREKAGPPNV